MNVMPMNPLKVCLFIACLSLVACNSTDPVFSGELPPVAKRAQPADVVTTDSGVFAPGDYLDPSVKLRVHAAKMIGNDFVVAHKLRGSKSPGVSTYKPDEQVRVWRKKK
jgi:hypothetical protein